jgi:Trypsin-like peptidase domain
MHTRPTTLARQPASLLKALLTGAAVIAAVAIAGRADANSNLCSAGACERDPARSSYESHDYRYAAALQRGVGPDRSLRRAELSDQDFSTFSGVGMISCSVDGATRSATAFLVGAFDIGVTVAHMFEKDAGGATPTDCFYNSMDSLGQVRERIPVSYVKSQWQAEADAFGQPAKDLAVVRLSQPSRYAQRTMPLGRFSGDAAPVVMVGYRVDLVADTLKHKARGTVYERREDGLIVSSVAGFIHDMDARGIAPGAPVIDERTGVIIGIHTRLPAKRNAMITMNDWLEATLRTEIQAQSEGAPN